MPTSPLSLPRRTPRAGHRGPLRTAGTRPRFTPDGSRELEDQLDRTCLGIAAGVRGIIPPWRLEGLLLGGGYGRGEGGVLRTTAGERPYNDLEFYVLLRGNRHLNERRFGHALHVLGEILTPQAGVEIEFKITSRRELQAAPVSMFSYDLVMGHHRFAGEPGVLNGCEHHREAEAIPPLEATRLLMNRCTGLLLAHERLQEPNFTATDADFVQRNLAKAELALGDAVLAASAQYHWSVRERHQRLLALAPDAAPPWLAEVRIRHAAGLDFKLHPTRSTAAPGVLEAQHARVAALAAQVWLWLEARRLGRPFASARDYARAEIAKCPELSGARNLLVNAKTFGRRAVRNPSRMMRHPRERIFNALALLLWEPAAADEPVLRAHLQRELQTDAATLPSLLRVYRDRWSRLC